MTEETERKPITDPVDSFELNRLQSLEATDRSIKREEDELSDVKKEYNGRISELKKDAEPDPQ
jgi:hypothetical protein